MSSVYRQWVSVMGGTITGVFYIRKNSEYNPIELERFSGDIFNYEARCNKLQREFSRDYFADCSIWFAPVQDAYHPVLDNLGCPLDLIKLSQYEGFVPAD